MANQEYAVKGKLTTTLAGADLTTLNVVVYKFLGPHTMQIFARAPVDASGNFKLTLAYGAVGSTMEIDLMPAPADLAPFGVFNIERSIPGLFFPRFSIGAGDWDTSGTVYTKTVTIAIPNYIWRRWEWLSEEFTVIGSLVKEEEEAFLPIPFAWVSARDVDLPLPYGGSGGGAQTDEWGHFTLTFQRIDFFLDYAKYYPTIRRYGTESWPDLIFYAMQRIGGVKTQIYSETKDDARPKSAWDEPHRVLRVRLVAHEGVTNDEAYPPIPTGDNFLMHGIGLVDPHSITDGYATTGPGDDLPNREDCPFGHRLHIKGQFDTSGSGAPRYYQVLYAKWDGAAAPALTDFKPIENESWTVSQFDTTTGDWSPLTIEPISGVVAGEKVYEIPDYTDITRNKKTRLIAWTTHRKHAGISRYPDGKYDLLIKAWDAAAADVALNAAHPERNRLTVVLDNRGPRALLREIGIFDILRTDEMEPYTPICPVFSKGLVTLPVRFDAIDEQEHFLKYHLWFITGHNFYVDEISKTYDGMAGALERFRVVRKHKQIGTGTVTVTPQPDQLKAPGGFPDDVFNWNVGSPDVVKCAYQVRLRVWDRTINGYGYIHRAEDTMHFSIEP